ncbi:hypothetical protein F5050DRAFT_883414 [Lentinula boryana]|uniref:Uncharacterized protein n=1 Tax=Lentinula boryana TaxID=40481 RepID=A0ABQ8Q4D3_9AGAR|nr:hypothetical protein F5050DRAFT_883414 [Lentinula boryana]
MISSPTLSTSCRILTVSTSLDRAVSFVQQVQTLSESDDKVQNCDNDNLTQEVQEIEVGKPKTLDEKAVPWTISNKYYSAQVHFLARTIKGLAPAHLKDVPAVIFIWKKGHAYKHHIQRICQDRDLNGSEPEVSLAVRIDSRQQPGATEEELGLSETDEEEFEDSAEIDGFLSSKGFEFIDIPASGGHEDEDVLAEAIPSLPRVLDALSTIMWPSMQASTKRQNRLQRSGQDQQSPSFEEDRSGDDALLDWAQNSFDQTDNIDLDIEDEANLVATQTPVSRVVHQTRMRKEMEELRRWLEEEPKDHSSDMEGSNVNDPWGRAASSTSSQPGMITMSPSSEEGGFSFSHSVLAKEDKFDDDFTVFVSAPAEGSSSGPSHPSTSISKTRSRLESFSEEAFPSFASFGESPFTASHPFDDESLEDTSFDYLTLSDGHSGIMYHSLASASDLGETLDEEVPLHLNSHENQDHDKNTEDNDDGLPTQIEIRASAQRIFGSLQSSSLSTSKKYDAISAESNAELDGFDDDMDFDLTHMVSAIQGMKAEISEMDDMDDRRKAAARVALGLVYGLDRRG